MVYELSFAHLDIEYIDDGADIQDPRLINFTGPDYITFLDMIHFNSLIRPAEHWIGINRFDKRFIFDYKWDRDYTRLAYGL